LPASDRQKNQSNSQPESGTLRDPFLTHCNPLGVSDPPLLPRPFCGSPALFGFGFLGTPPVIRCGAVVDEPLIDGFNLVL